jgi:hypothetical protein
VGADKGEKMNWKEILSVSALKILVMVMMLYLWNIPLADNFSDESLQRVNYSLFGFTMGGIVELFIWKKKKNIKIS